MAAFMGITPDDGNRAGANRPLICALSRKGAHGRTMTVAGQRRGPSAHHQATHRAGALSTVFRRARASSEGGRGPSAKTFWVDGESLGYNPAYLATLNDLELRGVLAHEVLHVANGHCWRRGRAGSVGGTTPVTTRSIRSLSSGMVLPKGALIDARFTDKSAEEIYGVLTQEAKQKQTKPDADATRAKQSQPSSPAAIGPVVRASNRASNQPGASRLRTAGQAGSRPSNPAAYRVVVR